MSWELHYEEITGIAHNSMQLFYELCQEYGQIPSYTLIRSSYWWFLRAESITYLLNQSTDGKLEYEMDLEESAYSSGTHIVCDGAWLQINAIENAGSYFREYPEYDYRAYPSFGNINGQAVLFPAVQTDISTAMLWRSSPTTCTSRLRKSSPIRMAIPSR